MGISFDLISIVYLLLTMFPVALTHELGHFLAGRLLGDEGGTIRFGSPNDPLVQIGVGRLNLEIRLRVWL